MLKRNSLDPVTLFIIELEKYFEYILFTKERYSCAVSLVQIIPNIVVSCLCKYQYIKSYEKFVTIFEGDYCIQKIQDEDKLILYEKIKKFMKDNRYQHIYGILEDRITERNEFTINNYFFYTIRTWQNDVCLNDINFRLHQYRLNSLTEL